MRRFLRPDARTVAVAAALATGAVVVVLVFRHPAGIMTVGLALLGVLFATVTGTALAALRERDDREPPVGATAPGLPEAGSFLDADTLDALDSAAVLSRRHRMREVSDQ
ncbi:hypothetical protein FJK98_30725 [Micromonospora sp. HM134]|uniref:hypothetical protein n=1 Tax=unclassified Micromonospora TaxID=2617518 RepID=UPI001198BF99|nr:MULTISPECIES: hypothetical protein [unclassified Micromonospora]QDY10987.1 hypothetical protein FJK98_30725 [Micromonospora sp. HM134]